MTSHRHPQSLTPLLDAPTNQWRSLLLSYTSAHTFCHVTGTSAPYSFLLFPPPGTLNGNSHLGSATFYWLMLTLSRDFLWPSDFWTLTLLLLCPLLMVPPYCEWPLKRIHTASCAGGHIYRYMCVYFFKLITSPGQKQKDVLWKMSV